MNLSIRHIGKSLSRMVMPNIGAFIAWGLITALFIPAGWLPNERLALLVEPMLKMLLPILIAYTGGSNVAGQRGGVAAAISVTGIIAGSDVPMFIGAMAMGPLAGWLLKRFDSFAARRVPEGFEMLVNNFSVGILGVACAVGGYYAVGPLMGWLTGVMASGVAFLMAKGVLPLVSVFIEPAKVLFLNNAINHGILTPIGVEQVHEGGRSLLFLLESNPGPGLGLLVAYSIFGRKSVRQSAPTAAVIHFFGGIHEIYFPYVLMRPAVIVAPIAGSAAAIAFYMLFGGALVAPASPGSILTVLAMAPKGRTLIVLAGVAIAAVVSFLISIPFVRKVSADSVAAPGSDRVRSGTISKIVFACDAGMGSSAMGARRFARRLADSPVEVTYAPVDKIPAGTQVVVCQSMLTPRARKAAPDASVVTIGNFLNDPALEDLYLRLTAAPPVLARENILLGLPSESKADAIRRAGQALVDGGYATAEYIGAMIEREEISTTYLGAGIAIPHGTEQAKDEIKTPGVVVLQYPDGADFDGEKAYLVVGIAADGDRHVEILSRLAAVAEDAEQFGVMARTGDREFIYNILEQ